MSTDIELYRAIQSRIRGVRWERRRGGPNRPDYPFGSVSTGYKDIAVACLEPPASYVMANACRNYDNQPGHHNRIHHARVRWVATRERRGRTDRLELGQMWCGGITLVEPIYSVLPERACKHPASMCPRCEVNFHPNGLAGVCDSLVTK